MLAVYTGIGIEPQNLNVTYLPASLTRSLYLPETL